MKKFIFLGLISLNCTVAQNSVIKSWYFNGSYDEFLRTSQRLNKLPVLDFGAKWCTSCGKLERENEDKYALNKKFIFYKVDVDSNDGELLSKKYKVKEIPTMVVLDKKFNIIKRIPSPYPYSYLAKELMNAKF